MKSRIWLLIAVASLGLTSCDSLNDFSAPVPTWALPSPAPLIFPKIDRQPAPANYGRSVMQLVPHYDAASDAMWQMDLRSYDLSTLDFGHSLADLMYASFDTLTRWPRLDKLPPGFDWHQIMELGKNPGLGMRALHAQGITGQGVGIAIVDQPLLVNHQEYADQLRLYEETNDVKNSLQGASMHGPAVASIAVGKTTGVAPQADLYYIATAFGSASSYDQLDFSYLAYSVRRILDINRQLPADRKIRVISMSIGWDSTSKGYAEIKAAVDEAKAAGMLVICSSVEAVHGFKFQALGRAPLADPDAFEAYEPGLFWAKQFYANPDQRFSDRLLVPMDSRSTAAPNGNNAYAFYREGGWSWSIPYIAGMYALAAQVNPAITPDRFWSLAMKTGRTIQLQHDGQTIPFGPILYPAALIEALQSRNG